MLMPWNVKTDLTGIKFPQTEKQRREMDELNLMNELIRCRAFMKENTPKSRLRAAVDFVLANNSKPLARKEVEDFVKERFPDGI